MQYQTVKNVGTDINFGVEFLIAVQGDTSDSECIIRYSKLPASECDVDRHAECMKLDRSGDEAADSNR